MIRIRETGAVVSDREFRQMHPNVAFPRVLTQGTVESFGVDVVVEQFSPEGTNFRTIEIQPIEQEVDGTWVRKREAVLIPLEQAKNVLKNQVNGERRARKTADLERFHTLAITASMLHARGITNPVLNAPRADGTLRSVTAEQAINLWLTAYQRINALDQAEQVHLTAIESLKTSEACEEYDTSIGWPE